MRLNGIVGWESVQGGVCMSMVCEGFATNVIQFLTFMKNHCSFCKTASEIVSMMVTGPEGRICDQCVTQAAQIIQLQKEDNLINDIKPVNLLGPKDIKAHLDEYVIGQEEAKKTLSIASLIHLRNIQSPT